MPLVKMFDKWGGLRTLQDPSVLGPALAQSIKDIDLRTGILRNRFGETIIDTSATLTQSTMYDYNGTLIYDTEVRQYWEYGNRVIRGYVIPTTNHAIAPQYSIKPSDTATYPWHVLGISAPISALAGVAGAAGSPNGVYQYYTTFYNTYGDESAPSPVTAYITVANQQVTLTSIPINFGNATRTAGSATLTAVANPTMYRVGMRLANTNTELNGKYVTAVNAGASTVTLDSSSGITNGTDGVWDSQIIGRYLYRTGGTIGTVLRVDTGSTLADVTTAGYTDTAADTALGQALDTANTTTLPDNLSCIVVSPNGLLMGITCDGTLEGTGTKAYFSEAGRIHLYTTGNYINLPDPAVGATYGLDRFVIFTTAGVVYVLGDDPASLDVNTALGRAPSVAQKYNVPVMMDEGLLWFVTKIGVCVFDGSQVKSLTENIFDKSFNEYIYNNVNSACRWGSRWVCSTELPDDTGTYDESLLIYDPGVPGSWYRHSVINNTAAGAPVIVFSSGDNCVAVYHWKSGDVNYKTRGLEADTTRVTNGVYWTTDWAHESKDALLDFRRVYVMHNGALTVQPYVDGVAVGSAASLTRTTFGRSEFYLPRETSKGRTLSLKFTLTAAAALVSEAGAWVKELAGR